MLDSINVCNMLLIISFLVKFFTNYCSSYAGIEYRKGLLYSACSGFEWIILALRILAMYEAKSVNTCNILKSWGTIFWQMGHRWEKWSQSLITPPGGWSEIGNGEKTILTFFNFSSATVGHFSNVNTLFYIYRPFVKKASLRFFERRCINRNIEHNVREWCSLGFIHCNYP